LKEPPGKPDTPNLSEELKKLVGNPCWGIVAGLGTGSHISLAFGQKHPRRRVLTNPHLTEDQQRSEGEYILYVTCAWRLQLPDKVICSSTSSNAEGGPLQEEKNKGQVKRIRDRSVIGGLS
jgi:hypothetical protein